MNTPPFARTVCGCSLCVAHCERVPGFLLPSDLDCLVTATGLSLDVLAASWLVRGVGITATSSRLGLVVHLPTIRARRVAGRCAFLTAEKRCAIHASAPYGCAHYDDHLSDLQTAERHDFAVRELLADTSASGPYSQLWHMLTTEDADAAQAATVAV